MSVYSFTVGVIGFKTGDRPYEDVFSEAGCGDALVKVVNDRLYLDFDRAAESFEDAVSSVKRDVKKAGGEVISVEPFS